ncbi:bleomycin hydrolase [Coemansia erecta]|nr:bleomycin hydrolase [Coemansia erecta]
MIDIDQSITNQKNSGLCWTFAALNMLHLKMIKEYNLKDFELSQPYLFFYDKLERSNWFLESILKMLDKDLDSRMVQHLLKDPISDGGQWDMFVALIEKYTPQYLGNVVGTKDVHYINLPINDFKRYAIETIKSGCPAWFGLHVEKFSMQKNDMVDLDVIDYKSAFNINFGLNKAEQMQYHDSHITHIVALTGVHIEDDKPVRWQIENSYGEDHSNKGYLTMTDKWFDEFAYVIVVDKNDLPSEILAVLDQDAIVLPPWNPMSRIK